MGIDLLDKEESEETMKFKQAMHLLCWKHFEKFHIEYREMLSNLQRENSSLTDEEVLAGLMWPMLMLLNLHVQCFFDVDNGFFKHTSKEKLIYFLNGLEKSLLEGVPMALEREGLKLFKQRKTP